MKRWILLVPALLILCSGIIAYAGDSADVEAAWYEMDAEEAWSELDTEDALIEIDDLAGAWRTGEDDEGFTTLLLYPEDAFRLYEYYKEKDETFMLEGSRTVEGDKIIVTEVRLGKLDSDGVYTAIESKDSVRFTFFFEFDGTHARLTLTDEQGRAILFHPLDMDSPE